MKDVLSFDEAYNLASRLAGNDAFKAVTRGDDVFEYLDRCREHNAGRFASAFNNLLVHEPVPVERSYITSASLVDGKKQGVK